jgi:hypothetical protein
MLGLLLVFSLSNSHFFGDMEWLDILYVTDFVGKQFEREGKANVERLRPLFAAWTRPASSSCLNQPFSLVTLRRNMRITNLMDYPLHKVVITASPCSLPPSHSMSLLTAE